MCGFKPLHGILSLGTVIVYAFDVTTNWYAFHMYLNNYNKSDQIDNRLTITLGCAASIGTLMLCMAVRNLVYGCRAFGAEDREEAQEAVERWQEVTSFLQMTLQDCVIAVIVYLTFREGTCNLYSAIFVDSLAGDIALIGILSGSAWKMVSSLINCMCRCCTNADTGCGWACACCVCRIASTIIAVGLVGFVSYQLFMINDIGFETRDDCYIKPTASPDL